MSQPHTITATVIKVTNNHVLIWYKSNPFSCDNAMGYITKAPIIENVKPKDEFPIPANPIPFHKTNEAGELMTTKDGEPLTFIKW